jgi:LDH2 family malate/lactate/ureidoglycolate dehydrogenase
VNSLTISADRALRIARSALMSVGLQEHDARDVAEVLVETSLRGIDTHGLRLLQQYVDEVANGVATANPSITPSVDRGATVQLDAGGALGVIAGLAATRLVIERAPVHGVSVVGVRNSNHFGSASTYSRRIADAGLVGLVLTSAASRVAPFGGIDPLFGTNPISIAAGQGELQFCLDMATSQVAYGQIKARGVACEPLEAGWATDEHGAPAFDGKTAFALSPLGGYKGQGLAMAVTLLGAVLTGGVLDWEMQQVGESPPGRSREVGHLLIGLDPAAFGGASTFAVNLAELICTTRSSRPARARPVLCPGDPEREAERLRRRNGIPLDPATAAYLRATAA